MHTGGLLADGSARSGARKFVVIRRMTVGCCSAKPAAGSAALSTWQKDPYAEVKRLGKLVTDFKEDDGTRAENYRKLTEYRITVNIAVPG